MAIGQLLWIQIDTGDYHDAAMPTGKNDCINLRPVAASEVARKQSLTFEEDLSCRSQHSVRITIPPSPIQPHFVPRCIVLETPTSCSTPPFLQQRASHSSIILHPNQATVPRSHISSSQPLPPPSPVQNKNPISLHHTSPHIAPSTTRQNIKRSARAPVSRSTGPLSRCRWWR